MIFVGGGLILTDVSEELLVFAIVTSMPVCTTLMGKGEISKEHPLGLDMIGMHGIETTNITLTECSCLIAISCYLSD